MGAKKSAKYMMVSSLISKAFSFIGSIVLARLLYPEDYGYLMIAMIFTAFAQMIVNIGYEYFYLQEKIETSEYELKILNITFFLRMFTNVLLFVIQFSASYFIEIQYNEIVGQLLRVFSFTYIITALYQTNLFILRKKVNLKPEAIGNLSRDIAGTLSKVLFAYIGFGALSFAWGSLIGNIFRFIVIIKYSKFIPSYPKFDKAVLLKIIHFGKHSFLGGIGLFFTQYIDKILLSKFFNSHLAGGYFFSSSQSQTFSSYLIQPQASLIVSYSSKYKHDTEYLYKKLKSISYILGVVSIPVFVYLFFFSDLIFSKVFGDKWIFATPLFQSFLILSWFQIKFFPISSILTAFGKPEKNSMIVWTQLLSLFLSLYFISLCIPNILYYAITYVCISIVFLFMKAKWSLDELNYNFKNYFSEFQNCVTYILINITILYIENMTLSNNLKLFFSPFIQVVVSYLYLKLTQRNILATSLKEIGINTKIIKFIRLN